MQLQLRWNTEMKTTYLQRNKESIAISVDVYVNIPCFRCRYCSHSHCGRNRIKDECGRRYMQQTINNELCLYTIVCFV